MASSSSFTPPPSRITPSHLAPSHLATTPHISTSTSAKIPTGISASQLVPGCANSADCEGAESGSADSGDSEQQLWRKSVELIRDHLDPQIFAAWIKPLALSKISASSRSETQKKSPSKGFSSDGATKGDSELNPVGIAPSDGSTATDVEILAPNRFCCDHVRRNYSELISSTLSAVSGVKNVRLSLRVGTVSSNSTASVGRVHEGVYADSKSSNRGAGLQRASAVIGTSATLSRATVVAAPGSALVESVITSNIEGATSDSISAGTGALKSGSVRANTRARPALFKTIRSSDGTNLNPKYNFSNFVVGACNQFAHAVSLRIAQNLGAVYNPLFFYGGVGLGKTHLVNAIGNSAARLGKSVLLISSEAFVNELIASLRSNRMQQFKSKFRSLDLLIVDDIQFLIGKERTQEEFFHTFNDLYNRHKQIVITSDTLPQELVGLEERLRTRFASGISADLQAPDFETRVAILTKKAEASGISLSDDVARLLSEKINTNVRELEGALNRLHAMSTMNGCEITTGFVEDALKSVIPSRTQEVTPELIQRIVAERYNVGLNDILGKRRTQNIAFARHVAMHLCRRLTARSFPEIGALFGGRDHSTVIHANRVIEERAREDSQIRADITALEKKISG